MSIVTVQKDRYTVEPLYQWDVNQVLEISGLSLPSIPQIHFTNEAMDKAIVRQAAMDGAGVITADVPNSLLQKPYKIKAYVCIYEGETFETLYKIEIPVNARKKPADYTIEDDQEVYSFNKLEADVNDAVAKVDAVYDELNDKIHQTSNELSNTTNQVNTNTSNIEVLQNQFITEGTVIYDADTYGTISDENTSTQFEYIIDGETLKKCKFVRIYATDHEKWILCHVYQDSADRMTIIGGGNNLNQGCASNGAIYVLNPSIRLNVKYGADDNGEYKWYISANYSGAISVNKPTSDTDPILSVVSIKLGSIVAIM